MSKKVDAIAHKAKRANIPTNELRGFMEAEEAAPKAQLYPRDPTLDPQLVWKGKDEQDRAGLSVPLVPVYIQEKIHPQALIEDLRQAQNGAREPQADLFADFNGIKFEDLVQFYEHEQNWANRLILGDSLMVMASLAEKEALKSKVQMIYMDPPYGIKFGSNWQVSTRKREVKDGKAEDASREPEVVKAFRDTWALGIHSYLTYLRDRFTVARDLLTESGSVFVQIGDENVHLVRAVLDEVFGSENFAGLITCQKTSSANSPTAKTNVIAAVTDFVLWYARDFEAVKYRPLYAYKELGSEGTTQYVWAREPEQRDRRLSTEELEHQNSIPKGSRVFAADNLTSQTAGQSTIFQFEMDGANFEPGKGGWKTMKTGMIRLQKACRLKGIGKSLMYRRYFDDFPVSPLNNLWRDVLMTGFSESKVYVVQTSTRIVQRCLLMTTDPGDLVLDPTCGSGTTAHVAEQWGRRWITTDTSRVALALARTRIMAARYPNYLLADSPEGVTKETELTGRAAPDHKTHGDVRKGFVYKRVPHVTLRSIANNPEIDAIHDVFQPKLDTARATLNAAANTKFEAWEILVEPDEKWSVAAKKAHSEWWTMRRARQEKMDASIAKNGDQETLYDQPHEDPKRVRVAGPFTVESLSPHRVLAADEDRDGEVSADERAAHGDLVTTLLDYLKKAGVQNTKKDERLKFDRLDPFAGLNIQAEGEYATADGKAQRVAVAFGPENGTVGPELVREAAIEAVQGRGFDVLLVCGFAFDAHVGEEAKKYGKLVVLPVKMNPDLAMGDELLKKTGAGNLFMVFGEPDVEVKAAKDGRLTVKIKGVDVYDPTTGQIRSSSVDDIACWFIDTAYDGRSFFVRHAYFTGADEPYEKLKRALRAEIAEDAWATLYSDTSRPFDKPKTGKIAVKVINHYGDEVLKVYAV